VRVLNPATLTCAEVVELVTEYLGNAMSAEDRVRIEQHLLVCPPCTIHVGQVRTTIELMARLRDAPSASVAPALVDVFRRWKK